jgi:hypothetical protein
MTGPVPGPTPSPGGPSPRPHPRPSPGGPRPRLLMITKEFVRQAVPNASRSWKITVRGVGVALGLLAVAWPLAWAPAGAYAVAAAGALAVLGAAVTSWRSGPALAAAAAIVASAWSRAGTAVLAAEGLFILCYLIAADAPRGLNHSASGAGPGSSAPWARWLRSQVRLGVAGLIGSGAVLAALALHQASAAWLTVAGLAAAVAAYLIALPRSRT